MENVAPDGDRNTQLLLMSTDSGRRLSYAPDAAAATVTSQLPAKPPAANAVVPAAAPASPTAAATTTTITAAPAMAAAPQVPPPPPSPAVLSERPAVDVQQQQHQLSKTLPRNAQATDTKRASRAPRAQSDPSNMPGAKEQCTAASALLHQQSPAHSESASSLSHLQQKRSQSDLSQVGSTESGYSSLSLNAPSPSHSPTRLSSGDFGRGNSVGGGGGGGGGGYCAAETQCDLDDDGVDDDDGDDDSSGGGGGRHGQSSPAANTWYEPPPHAKPSVTGGGGGGGGVYYCRPAVSRSCSAASSDAASQTECVVGLKSATTVTVGSEVAAATVRRKLPEEIECEELSRDLISHLSPSDKLHNILGELLF